MSHDTWGSRNRKQYYNMRSENDDIDSDFRLSCIIHGIKQACYLTKVDVSTSYTTSMNLIFKDIILNISIYIHVCITCSSVFVNTKYILNLKKIMYRHILCCVIQYIYMCILVYYFGINLKSLMKVHTISSTFIA